MLCSFHDGPQAELQAGRALRRVLLTATSLGPSASFMSQPVEVRTVRTGGTGTFVPALTARTTLPPAASPDDRGAMDNLVSSPVPPVVVATGGSRPDDAALCWATAHARLVGAPVEVRPPDRVGALPRAGLLVTAQTGCGPAGVGRHVLSLVDHAACDVVVVRGSAAPGHHRVTALLTGADDDPVLTRAAVLAKQRGAALRVLYATPPLPVRADDPEWPLAHADRVLHGVRHTSVLARMHPHEAIARYADTDLLVVGGSGPTTRAALHHARCPVFVARRAPSDVVRRPTALPRQRVDSTH